MNALQGWIDGFLKVKTIRTKKALEDEQQRKITGGDAGDTL